MVSAAARAACCLLLAGACTVTFDSGNAQFRCEQGACPTGQRCLNGVCVPDNGDGGTDGPQACEATTHLVLSEVNAGPTRLEFIEIANPTNANINLDDVFLSDDPDYALTPGLDGAGPAPNLTGSDFIVQFPPGIVLEPGEDLIIAFESDDFAAEFGQAADLSIGAMIRIAPPTGTPTLSNAGESITLFRWNGASDLVTDIDRLVYASPAPADLSDKTGLSVDGPDADEDASTYANDAATSTPVPYEGSTDAIQRIIGEAGREISDAGNGTGGQDETTEELTETWSVFAPTPGVLAFCIP